MTSDLNSFRTLARRPLGSTSMEGSCLGLGTVKIGRVRGSVLAGPVIDGRSVSPGLGFAGSF